jgi:hypothetical protein
MNASWDAWILGIIVFLVSLGALFREESWPEWLDLILGVWIFIAPWVLGFAAALPNAAWDHWVVGVIIAVLGFWSAMSPTPSRPATRG